MFTSFWSTETFIKKLYFFCFKFFRCKGKKIKIWQKKKKKKKARKFHAIQLYKKKIGKRKFLCPTPTFLIL